MRDSMKDDLTSQNTYTRGRLPQVWQHFQRSAEIRWALDRFKEQRLVAIHENPDDLSFDDLHGDTFDVTIDHGINVNVVRKQRAEAMDRLEQEGQWAMEAVFRDPGEDGWHSADSIGGFVGEDFWGSGYEDDLRIAALEALFNHYGGKLPDYVPSKTGAWTKAVLMGWQIIRGNTP
jgi:hypothetical protein